MLQNKPLLSLCMIVKNEAVNIQNAIESVKNIADELIVVDTGSADNTRELAESLGADVYSFEWINDFSAAKNAAIERANGEWILFLDADEALENNKNNLREYLQKTEADALQIKIRNKLPETDIASFQEFHLTRVFRNRPEYRYSGAIHEQISPVILSANGSIQTTHFSILHSGYSTDKVQGGNSRNERNLQLLEKAVNETPSNAYLLYHLGATYKEAGNNTAAKSALEQSLQYNMGELSIEILEKVYAKLAQISLAEDDYPTAAERAAQCLAISPENLAAQYIVALAKIYSGSFSEAHIGFTAILNNPNINPHEVRGLKQVIQFCEQRIGKKVTV